MPQSCNNWEEYLMESYEQCCEDFPNWCSANVGCTTSDYDHFKTTTNCAPDAWEINFDDCWIDSSLFAMFAPYKSSVNFSNMLDVLNDSVDEDERKIAYYIRNYLNGLYDPSWSKKENCKQVCKNEIGEALLRWNSRNGFALDIGEDDIVASTTFERNDKGDIGSGPQYIIYKFFSLKFNSQINSIEIKAPELFNYCQKPYKPKKLVKNIIKSNIINNDTNMVFLHLNFLDKKKCDERTRIVEIKKIGNYELQSIVYGSGIHTQAAVLCNNRFILYDNNEMNRINMNLNNTDYFFTNSQEITLVYVKVSTSKGGKKSRKNKTYLRRSRN